MTNIRVIAATATALLLPFAFSPASAGRCDDDKAVCLQPSSPMMLDQFMKTWKPANVSTQKKKYRTSRTSRRHAVKEVAASKPETPAESKLTRSATGTPPPAETITAAAAVAEQPVQIAQSAKVVQAVETDGIAVTSFYDVNELDATANRVQVVAFNEVNEVDLAAPPPPPAQVETVGQSVVSANQPAADNSWIGKLLLVAAGTLAIAGATRLFVSESFGSKPFRRRSMFSYSRHGGAMSL